MKLLFTRSKDEKNIKKPVRVLRGNSKVKFKVMSRCTGKYLNSPLYRGTVIRDLIPLHVQKSLDVFTKHIRLMNHEYNGQIR